MCQTIIAMLSFKFMKIPSKRIYGLEKITIKNKEVIVSSKERTLVDLVYFNKAVGGIKAAKEIFERIVREKKCDIKKLIEYSVRFSNIKTRKLIGLILEETGVSDAMLNPLEKSVKNSAPISFSNSRKGTLNKRWKVIINDT